MPSVCCLFITICNCRTACLGWGGRTQFDFGSSMLHRFLPFSPVIANFASSIASFIILVLFFMVAYKVLPDKSLDFKSLSVGAIVTVILITIGKYAVGLLLAYSNPVSVYGAIGAIIGLFLLIFYSSIMITIGVEFTKVYSEI